MARDISTNLIFDLNLNNLEDYSGNSRDATNSNSTLTNDEDNRLNNARAFSGTNQAINGIDSTMLSGLSTFTSYHRVRFDALSTDRSLLSNWDTGSGQVLLFYDTPNVLRVLFREQTDSTMQVIATYTPPIDGTWIDIFVVFDAPNATLKLYADTYGSVTQIGSTTAVATDRVIQTADNDLYIGTSNNASRDFDGAISKTKMWDIALTEEEMRLVVQGGVHNYAGLFDGLVCGLDMRNDAKDFSGNGETFTVSGPVLSTDRFGIANSAYYSDGVDDYIRSDDNFVLDAMTIAFDISIDFDDLGDSLNFLVSQWDNGSATGKWFFRAYTDTDRITIYANDDNTIRTIKSSLNSNQWYRIMMTRSTSEINIYVDGELELTFSNTFTTTNEVIEFFGSAGTASRNSKCKISKSFLWNKELSPAQAKLDYDLIKSGYIYPYPQHRVGGITE